MRTAAPPRFSIRTQQPCSFRCTPPLLPRPLSSLPSVSTRARRRPFLSSPPLHVHASVCERGQTASRAPLCAEEREGRCSFVRERAGVRVCEREGRTASRAPLVSTSKRNRSGCSHPAATPMAHGKRARGPSQTSPWRGSEGPKEAKAPMDMRKEKEGDTRGKGKRGEKGEKGKGGKRCRRARGREKGREKSRERSRERERERCRGTRGKEKRGGARRRVQRRSEAEGCPPPAMPHPCPTGHAPKPRPAGHVPHPHASIQLARCTGA